MCVSVLFVEKNCQTTKCTHTHARTHARTHTHTHTHTVGKDKCHSLTSTAQVACPLTEAQQSTLFAHYHLTYIHSLTHSHTLTKCAVNVCASCYQFWQERDTLYPPLLSQSDCLEGYISGHNVCGCFRSSYTNTGQASRQAGLLVYT